MIRRHLAVICLMLVAAVAPMPACSTAYYKTMEVFGKEKRDILVSRVKDAKSEQQETKKQFASTLDEFSALVNYKGGDLRKAYDKAKDSKDKCDAKASALRDRVGSVEKVGRDLFREWEQEIQQYSSADLKSNSQKQLADSRDRFDQMLASMKRATASMDPVLTKFNDQVLSLKHTLNAQAVAAMKDQVTLLQSDVSNLIKEMEASIAEADSFIKQMGT